MKVSVLGATGYAGAELLRILYQHPQADVVHITSESHTGESIASLYPHLRGLYDMKLESMQDIRAIGEDSDFIFIGLPHGHAMEVARALADLPVRIIDLGADFGGGIGAAVDIDFHKGVHALKALARDIRIAAPREKHKTHENTDYFLHISFKKGRTYARP